MSRSGYSEECDEDWGFIRWRGAVASAIRGKRGQAFLKEILAALDAMSEKRLIANDLEQEGAVCAIGSVGKTRGIDMSSLDPEDYHTVAATFGIARALAQEIVYENDEGGPSYWGKETPEERYTRMRKWIASLILVDAPNARTE